jgi:hypothetical protein
MSILFNFSILIAIGTLHTAALAGEWVKLAENERLVVYYEPKNPDPAGNATLWVIYDYKVEQSSPSSGRKYRSQKGQQQIDCQGQRSRTIFFTWHTEQMANGLVAYTGRTALPWEPNSPGSIARTLASMVCK